MLQRAVVNGYYMRNVTKLILKRDKRQIILECSLYKVLRYLSYEREVRSISVWWHHTHRHPKFSRINWINQLKIKLKKNLVLRFARIVICL